MGMQLAYANRVVTNFISADFRYLCRFSFLYLWFTGIVNPIPISPCTIAGRVGAEKL